ncbi:hypothetical protein [Rubellicoccus peritrichatus]|uniref:Uncharacterized protein n=1 Tax=Rubellicoccus peritrichatus TaxID=3080537 RepID=A0AAQ3LCW3_9BACT|nr:hypothetical protein [Puniceicoccus sp. CR14]WOO41575.1 hypothetical protein RZN69_00640 [Puniceicoccus sp. CR14]
MGELVKIFYHLFCSFIVIGFLAIGISMLVTSKERLMERFSEFFFMFTNRSYDHERGSSAKYFVLTARASGIFSLMIAFAGAWFVWQKIAY